MLSLPDRAVWVITISCPEEGETSRPRAFLAPTTKNKPGIVICHAKSRQLDGLKISHWPGICETIKSTTVEETAMVILNFTLSEEGVAVLHDALACMFKFSDDVSLEARKDKVGTVQAFSKLEWLCLTQQTDPVLLVDAHNTQHFQIGICLFLFCRQQILFKIQLRGHSPASRPFLLPAIHPGMTSRYSSTACPNLTIAVSPDHLQSPPRERRSVEREGCIDRPV